MRFLTAYRQSSLLCAEASSLAGCAVWEGAFVLGLLAANLHENLHDNVMNNMPESCIIMESFMIIAGLAAVHKAYC